MRLPSKQETAGWISGGIPSCGWWSWTSDASSYGKHWGWYLTSQNSGIGDADNRIWVRCVK